MFFKNEKVLVHGFGGHSRNEFYIVEDERFDRNAPDGTVLVRMQGYYGPSGVQAFYWPKDQVTKVTPSDRRKTQFTIIFEDKNGWYRAVGTTTAHSAEAALEKEMAAFELNRPDRRGTYRILAVMPTALYDLLPSNAFEDLIDWRYELRD